MPTYEYICGSCGHELEVFQSMSEARKRKCPDCGTLKLQRKIGMGAGIIFKGSGFYETDYRSSSYSEGKKAESESMKKIKADAEKSSKPKKDKKEKSAGKA
jgi:putative FmdB family regulatory protein